MKQQVMSFKIDNRKPRDLVARDMLDRNGPYRERVVSKKNDYKRKAKNLRETIESWGY